MSSDLEELLETQTHIRSEKTFSQIAQGCALLVLVIAIIAMLGWGFDLGILTRFKEEFIPMAPSTGLGFILLSLGLFVYIRWPSSRYWRPFSTIVAAFASCLGLFIFIQFVFGFDLGLEHWLSKTSNTFGKVPIGRMSPITAMSFLLAGLSLMFLQSSSKKRGAIQDIAVATATGIVVANLLVLLGYWYRGPLIFGGGVVPVALPTGLCFFLLGMGLVAAGSFHGLMRRDFLPVAISIAVGALLSISTFFIVERMEEKNIQSDFERQAANLANVLVRSFDTDLDELNALGNLYTTFPDVSRLAFRSFVSESLLHHSSIQALEWIPRVPDSERKAYETAARKEGFRNFQFSEQNDQGELISAGRRQEYFPVYFVEPPKGNELALGFDLSSHPIRKEALEKARDTGGMVATARIKLVQERGEAFGILAFRPVYRMGSLHQTIQERRTNLAGFALGVFRIPDMVETALSRMDREGVEFLLLDTTLTSDEQVLYGSIKEKTTDGNRMVRWTTIFDLGSRQWKLDFFPAPAYLAAHHGWQAWGVLGIGLLLTTLLGAYLLTSSRRAIEVEQQKQMLHKAYEESQQRAAELSALLEGSHAVLKYREFRDAEQSIFDSCKVLIGATAGYVALLSKNGTENEVLFLEPGGLPCAVAPSLPMPIRGLRAEAYRTGNPVFQNDFSKIEWMKFMPGGHVTLDNVLFAPLMIEGKAAGLLGLANKPGGFTESDARMAAAFGELVSIALKNSRTLELLESSEERFRSVVQTANDAIINVNSRGEIVFWNRRAEAIFGYSMDEIIGKPLTTLMPERFLESHQKSMKSVVVTGQGKLMGQTVELVGLKKEGGEFPVELSLATWRTKEDLFFTGVVRDITHRKRAEEERERIIRELQEALAKVKTLSGLIPICASCKKIRDDKGYWGQIESYIQDHSEAEFSHGICPDCMKKLYPDFVEGGKYY